VLRDRVVFVLLWALALPAAASPRQPDAKFKISFLSSARATPVTGRLLLILSRTRTPEPRLQAGDWDNVLVPIFGIDVSQLNPGAPAVIDESTPGFPVRSLRQLPKGDYYVQAVLNVYSECQRSDGHNVWVHLDHWEGQQFNNSPGNLISDVEQVHLDPELGYTFPLTLNKAIPPVEPILDTNWVKHIKFKSTLLSNFWGCPIYLGATVLLPKGYDSHPNAHYPVVYLQGHFSLEAPFGFDTSAKPTPSKARPPTQHLNTIEPHRPLALVNQALVRNETPYEFYKAWTSEKFPRVMVVTFQHPTPYYDDSYAVNSANLGPYGDAIMRELIPAFEDHFRAIRQPYARVLTGGSTGGWESLALQIQHPDFFGGTWSFYPDPIDFRRWGLLNIYKDESYYHIPGEWVQPERYFFRSTEGQPQLTNRQLTELELVLGSKLRSGEQFAIWQAVYGPVGDDGYPKPLYDTTTGKIDESVALYMREHGYDLRDYLERNWPEIGSALVGKIHIIAGDMDNFYLNLAVYRMEDFLANSHNPYYGGSFQYGRPTKGHGWQPSTNYELIITMAKQIEKNASSEQDSWHYK
jgi:Putative esterase